MTYEIFEVPNGRMREFIEHGWTGQGWPDACKSYGVYDTIDDLRESFAKLAEISLEDAADSLNGRLFDTACLFGLSDDIANDIAWAGRDEYIKSEVKSATEGDPKDLSLDLGDLKYLRVLVRD